MSGRVRVVAALCVVLAFHWAPVQAADAHRLQLAQAQPSKEGKSKDMEADTKVWRAPGGGLKKDEQVGDECELYSTRPICVANQARDGKSQINDATREKRSK